MKSTQAKQAARKKSEKSPRKPTLSRTRQPEHMTALEWQRGLRHQFGREQSFALENVGTLPVFSEFRVSNPESKSVYRVAIRGMLPGQNYCACPDYATNELGTCKHIEFTLFHLSKKRGGKAALARGYTPAYSEIYLRYGMERTIHFRPGADCPASLRREAAQLFDESQQWVLVLEKFAQLERFLQSALAAGHEVRTYDDARGLIATVRDAQRRAKVLRRVFPGDTTEPALGHLLKVPLYPYQLQGALFAVRAGRALIADDMGLGKTIQAIAVAEILARHFGVSRVLVICPASLKYQWQSEIKRFSGREAQIIVGGIARRQADYRSEAFCKITNYEKLQPDLDLIAAWAPELVIVDEAQRVKNWNTIAARALKRIDSPYAVVLTGTPLENKLEELISIVQFVDQYRLGPTWKLLHEHQQKDDRGRVIGYTGLGEIGITLQPIMLRRRKTEVLKQLPARTDQTLLLPMTDQQMACHEENALVVARIVQRWHKMKFLSDKDQLALTCALQNMRMACNSTYLLDHETDFGVKAEEIVARLDDFVKEPNAKAVVFSQWTGTHDILIRRLQERGIGHVSFHGGVPADKRPALLERFRADPDCRVFLSTDAGATGLNLQHASLLVNMDLPWNPALLEQRIGRIYRMGQSRPVQILNLVSKGTIEEGMLSILAFKRSLAAGILDGASSELALGGSRLTQFMKDVQKVTALKDAGNAVLANDELAGSGLVVSQVSPSSPEVVSTDAKPEVADDRVAGDSAPDQTPRQIPENPLTPAVPTTDPWQTLGALGTTLLGALAAAVAPNGQAAHPWVARDPETGQGRLSVPLPPPEVAQKLADVFAQLATAFKRH